MYIGFLPDFCAINVNYNEIHNSRCCCYVRLNYFYFSIDSVGRIFNNFSIFDRIDGVLLNVTTAASKPVEINNGTVLLDRQIQFTSDADDNNVVLVSLQFESGKYAGMLSEGEHCFSFTVKGCHGTRFLLLLFSGCFSKKCYLKCNYDVNLLLYNTKSTNVIKTS